jgi:hypothetical protein
LKLQLKSIAGVLSFANLTGRTKPVAEAAPTAAAAAAEVPAEQATETVDTSAEQATETPEVPAAEVPAPAAEVETPAAEATPAAAAAAPAAEASAEDEDDDEAEMRGASAEATARARERARCAAILASAGAARNPVLACSLAFSTSMTRSQAIATLDAMPEPANPASQSRASRNPNLGTGGDPHVTPAQAQAAGWDRAFKQATAR